MKNNNPNRLLLLILGTGITITATAIMIAVTNLPVHKNELAREDKEVLSPSVPLVINLPSSPGRVSNKKKVIKKLSLNLERTLTIFEAIDRPTEEVGRRITALSKESKEPIVLLLDSPGGSVLSGEKIVSAIEASRADVYTVCVGMCASMAAIIHAYGTKRLATDRAVLMYHDASAMVGGRVSEMLSILNLIRRKLDKTNHYIANRSKISYQELINLEANNFWLDAEDALEKGLVDSLVVVEE